ncbi:CPBP family intramembrane glutamic endopeptidase [uncultured Modestobacter sp.]|uniref:CPBP family intramembrane glutamic endopeptidase n=1 Tax=uncultured Modestobacter sp. TaxID=380048 RepID=UPI00260B7C7F|nr:CPBP family intramembrane glutamic endopeptidase [uncultured Modestobacter sp.]
MTPPGAPPHAMPRPYVLLMRARDWAWWRPVLGLLLFTVLYLVAGGVLGVVVYLSGVGLDLAQQDLFDVAVLLITNLSLIVAIPIVWLCWLVPHGLRIGWSSSVRGRLRWRLFAPWTWRALATLGLAVAISLLVSVAASGVDVTGPTASFGWMLLVVLTTTPLQAAAEEYVFRGYLTQAIAGWIGRPQAGALVAGVSTAVLFSLAHLPPDFESFLYRFAIGLALSAVVWLTGGLEAAIALHAVNNVVIFLLAGALGDRAAAVDPGGVLGWATTLLGIAGMAAFVAWVVVARRGMSLEMVSPALEFGAGGSPGAALVGGPPGPPAWGAPAPGWSPPGWGQQAAQPGWGPNAPSPVARPGWGPPAPPPAGGWSRPPAS